MKKNIKKYIMAGIMFSILFVLSACANGKQSTEEPVPIVVIKVEGTTYIQHSIEGTREELKEGQILVEEDIVTTGTESEVVIALEEGKEVIVCSDTIFALSAIRRDSEGNVNIMALKQGSVINNVETKLNEGDIYEVYTPRLVMSVRGTSNYMETGADGDKVIGITGETHVYAGDQKLNVLQGMTASQDSDGEILLAPMDFEGLPVSAQNFVSDKEIEYTSMSQNDIEDAQKGIDNDVSAYELESNREIFIQDFLKGEIREEAKKEQEIADGSDALPSGEQGLTLDTGFAQDKKQDNTKKSTTQGQAGNSSGTESSNSGSGTENTTPEQVNKNGNSATGNTGKTSSGNQNTNSSENNQNTTSDGGGSNNSETGDNSCVDETAIVHVVISSGGSVLNTDIYYSLEDLEVSGSPAVYSLSKEKLLSDYSWLNNYFTMNTAKADAVSTSDNGQEYQVNFDITLNHVLIKVKLKEMDVNDLTLYDFHEMVISFNTFSISGGLLDLSASVQSYLDIQYDDDTVSRSISSGSCFTLSTLKNYSEANPIEVIIIKE